MDNAVKTKWIVLTKDIEFFKSNLSGRPSRSAPFILCKEVIPKGCAILVFTGNHNRWNRQFYKCFTPIGIRYILKSEISNMIYRDKYKI